MSTGSIAGGGTGFRKRKRATVEETVGGGGIDYTATTPDGTGGTGTGSGTTTTKPSVTTDVLGGKPKPKDPYKDPKVVDKIINPLSRGPDKPPTIHVAPSPTKGPNVFNPNAGGSLSPTITGVPTGGAKTGIGPDGVPVYVAPKSSQPDPKGKTSINPALTGVSQKEVNKSPTEYGKGPNGENVHKAPSPKQGSHPGKQTLSPTVFASNNMPASASGKNVKHVDASKLKDNKGKDNKDNKGGAGTKPSTVEHVLSGKDNKDNKGKGDGGKDKVATKDNKPETKPAGGNTKAVSDPGKDKPKPKPDDKGKGKPDNKPAPKPDNKPAPKPVVKDNKNDNKGKDNKNDNKGKDNKKDDKKDNKSMSPKVVVKTGGKK